MPSSLLEWALFYVEQGRPVFPVHYPTPGGCSCRDITCEAAGKHPATSRGFKDATLDPRQVREWWETGPQWNIATPVGEREVVLDVDPRNGGREAFVVLMEEGGPPPPGPHARTGGGGDHYWFAVGHAVSPAHGFRPGLDLQGSGSYVVLPPSLHRSGARYSWIQPLGALAAAPSWLLEAAGRAEAPPGGPGRAGGPSREFALDSKRKIPHGQHHDFIVSTAAALARRIHGLEQEEGVAMLRAALGQALDDVDTHEAEIREAVRSAIGKFRPPEPEAKAPTPAPSPPAASPASPRAPHYDHLWEFVPDNPKEPEGSGKHAPLRAEFEDTLLNETRFLTFRDSREFRIYDPARGYYVAEAETYIAAWVRARFLEKKDATGQELTANSRFVSEVAATIRDRSYRDRADVNPPWALVLRNGVFDLRSSTLTPHAPEPPHTWALPVAWDPAATAPLFEAFLLHSLPDDVVRAALLEAAGYALWPNASLRRGFFLFGPTTTGKTTFLDVLRGVLGPENTTSVELAELVDNHFRAAELYGRLANIRADLPPKLVHNIGLFQELTGGRDLITAEKKHQHPFQFLPTAKMFFSANRMPRIPGATPAFWLRWLLFSFDIKVEKEQGDYSVTLLEKERDGIFRLFAEASRRLYERGKFVELPMEVSDRWMRNSDPALYICQNEIVDSTEGVVSFTDLQKRVGDLCDEEGIDEPPDPREIGLAMRRAHPRMKRERLGSRGEQEVRYRGVAWTAVIRTPSTAVLPNSSDTKKPPRNREWSRL